MDLLSYAKNPRSLIQLELSLRWSGWYGYRFGLVNRTHWSGARSSATASLIPPVPAGVPHERARLAGGRAIMKGVLILTVQNSAGTPGGGTLSTLSAVSTGVMRLGVLPAPARQFNH